MNAQVALLALAPTSANYELNSFMFNEQSTGLTDRSVRFEANLQRDRGDVANDAGIETSPAPFRMPSTFTRFKPSNHIAPEELAEWDGCVTEIQNEGRFFSATLNGIKGMGVKGQEEDALIPISDVAEWDKELLCAGNYFRLCVMQGVDQSGEPIRYTKVVFRRMPAYRQQDLDDALVRGSQLARGLRVE